MMMKKLIRKVNRSKIAKFFYYIQLLVLAPILFPIVSLGGLAEFILKGWCAYKEWYFSKTLCRK